MPSSPVSASAILKHANVSALLVTNAINMRYLTGVSVSAGVLLISKKRFEWFLDSRYSEKAAKYAYKNIMILPIEEWMKRRKSLKEIGFESENVTYKRFDDWKRNNKNTKFVQTLGIIEHFRRTKSTEEIRAIKKACAITKSILKDIPLWLKPGSTEKNIAWKIREAAYERGAHELAFNSIVGFGSHTAIPHHEPTDRRFKKGDMVQIDMGVKYNGYCSDYSRVIFTTQKTAEQKKIYSALLKAKKSAEKLLRVGVTNHALDLAARSVLQKYGLNEAFSHSLGHGLGLEIHEGVALSSRAQPMHLLKNEVVTIEPGVYFPGKWGMRVEDTYIVG